jgi:general secretion pathway protein A
MYEEHFGLKEPPFSIAPDPRYLYLSEQHREALAHLVYGIKSDGGFVLLTGEVGTGKTTVCRCLLEQIPEFSNIAFILNPKVSAEELMAAICDELGISYPEGNTSNKVFVDAINAYLLDAYARSRRTVLILEEAQNLSLEVLEQIRLLTNLETNQQKLLQIIMIGQPELKEILSRPDMLQLSQRITARYHIGPLSEDEVGAYVNHRLAVAGAKSALFADRIIGRLYRLSRGIPRLINVICDRALLGAYVQGKEKVDRKTLTTAAREVTGERNFPLKLRRHLRLVVAGLVIILCAVIALAFYENRLPFSISGTAGDVRAKEKLPEGKTVVLRWPDGQPLAQSRALAYAVLFKQWQIPYQPDAKSSPCEQATAHGLRCLSGSVSLNGLLRLNRPAVLKLFDEKNHAFFATLVSYSGGLATFSVGGKDIVTDADEIGRRWYGDYAMFWKTSLNYTGNIRPGHKGPEAVWIDKQLSLINGRKAKAQGEKDLTYNASLVNEVKKFQLNEGLVPDGVIGPHTLILLNNVSGNSGPTLMVKREGR